jgi:hypothetical protein
MVDEANRMRAGAALPPLVADAAISQASANHSRYWTLNRPSSSLGLGYHSETRGRPGFTGSDPGERCAAVGTECGSEIMYPGRTGAAAARGWIATIYHRPLLMDPAAHIVGAGQVGEGPAVMNGGRSAEYWQVAPIGYPRGLYDGDLSFSGEVPDPGSSCKRKEVAQRITAPYGTAVTLFVPPYATAKMLSVAPAGGRPIAGCRLDEAFVPDDPLLPGTTYTATGTWGEAARPFSWDFRTAGTAPRGSRRCRPRITVRLRRARLRVGYRVCGPSRLVVRARRRGARRPAVRRARTIRGGSGRVTVRLGAGRWRVTATLTGTSRKSRKSVTRTLRVRR